MQDDCERGLVELASGVGEESWRLWRGMFNRPCQSRLMPTVGVCGSWAPPLLAYGGHMG